MLWGLPTHLWNHLYCKSLLLWLQHKVLCDTRAPPSHKWTASSDLFSQSSCQPEKMWTLPPIQQKSTIATLLRGVEALTRA